MYDKRAAPPDVNAEALALFAAGDEKADLEPLPALPGFPFERHGPQAGMVKGMPYRALSATGSRQT
jgi:hypothetical protein